MNSILRNEGVDHLDDVSVHSCSTEQLVHGEAEATASQDAGQEITHHEDVSSTLLPPSVDWGGILRAHSPWGEKGVELTFRFYFFLGGGCRQIKSRKTRGGP